MSSVSGFGPVTPPNESRGNNNFSQALDNYAKLFSNPTPQDLGEIAQKTIELDKLAHSVMHAASLKIRATAGDLEHLLQSPLSIKNKDISILTASKNYLENPSNAELGDLIQVLCHNRLALGLMCDELSLLSNAIKNPNALGG